MTAAFKSCSGRDPVYMLKNLTSLGMLEPSMTMDRAYGGDDLPSQVPPTLLDLDIEALSSIASHLTDERDIASMSLSCRSLRNLYCAQGSDLVWEQLIERRWGTCAGHHSSNQSEPDPERASAQSDTLSTSSPQAPSPRRLFQDLASLHCPAAEAEVAWLDGSHLRVLPPGHALASGARSRDGVVCVVSVCWLDLGVTFHGVLPGEYRALWRVKAQPGWALDAVDLHASIEPTCLEASEVPKSGEENARTVYERVGSSALDEVFRAAKGSWVELQQPFQVGAQSSVKVRFSATSGKWKQRLVFDGVRLLREPSSVWVQTHSGGSLLPTEKEAHHPIIGWFYRFTSYLSHK